MSEAFRGKGHYTDRANELEGRIMVAVKPLIEEHLKEGFTLREIEYIAIRAMTTYCDLVRSGMEHPEVPK
jgi:hypothetical protein